MAEDGRKELDPAFEQLKGEVPDRVARFIRWLRDPESRWLHLPLGALFILGGLLSFRPVLGIELLPIGLLLIAQDVPFLRRPVADAGNARSKRRRCSRGNLPAGAGRRLKNFWRLSSAARPG